MPRAVVDAPVSRALWARMGRPPAWASVHAGDELELDARRLPFLKHAEYDVVGLHNLVDGREGAGGAFRAGARRDRRW